MVVALLLLSLALVATRSEAQSTAPDQKPPYSLAGVRRAAADAETPGPDAAADEPQPARPLTRSAARQKIDVATWSPEPTLRLPQSDRLVTTSLAPAGTAWHQDFLAMTQRDYGASPFDMMGNAERAQAVATSAAFAVAIEGVSRLVQHFRTSYREGKVARVRREIDEETVLVEQRYQAYLAEQKKSGADAPAVIRNH
jgi:hypothetical protein